MRTASGLFLAVLVVLGISSCGAMTQDAPAAKTSTAKVILKLPAGVSMKPGGTILSSDTKYNNAIVTGVTLSVTAADITTPLTADIPLDTNRTGVGHWCFMVDDLHAEYARLAALGVKFKAAQPVAIEHGVNKGGFTVYFTDPDGITLELVQPASG